VEFAFGDHILDVDRRELRHRGERIALEPQVFDLLVYLVRNRDRVVGKDDLLEAIWSGRIVSESTMTSRINAARKAVGDSGGAQRLIRTIPRKGIRFVGAVREEHKPAAPVDVRPVGADPPRPALALLDKPSIAVLPFANLSGDPEQEYFADGMVEEIITALSRIGGLLVIARNSTFAYKGRAVDVKQVGRELGVRYVLEGSVRKERHRVRIAAQLIEAATDAHLWADRFDGSLDDVFELQDKVALSVAGILEPTLQSAEIQLSSGRPTQDLTAYELYLRAVAPSAKGWDFEQIGKVLGHLAQAIERDPYYGPALGLAAICHSDLDAAGWVDDEGANRSAGLALARCALQVAGNYPDILCNIAYVLAYFGEDIAVATTMIDRALELKPSFANGWLRSGWIRLMNGQPEPAIQHFEIGMRLNPRDILGFALGIGAGHFFARRFEDAKAALLLSLEEGPGWVPPYRFLASCCAHLGQLDEAAEVVRRLRAMTRVVVPPATYWRNPAHRELFLDGLRLAASEPGPTMTGRLGAILAAIVTGGADTLLPIISDTLLPIIGTG
jgi:TolB-like protein